MGGGGGFKFQEFASRELHEKQEVATLEPSQHSLEDQGHPCLDGPSQDLPDEHRDL
jgi:hypothetical protein